ncbi:TetR/AcrR family transcriptional regulator [Sinanaerobacter sp. ZZT-01]|uniref:TetR/AcrR family transcriptional regulator n=1 Tax=Sinanaerobacter sp. ZZT-01 TaxID=3111540 RepID=UPI002D797B5D|nr:TetR/AcrR family transcriptional regulator [Sinanaerobacter sp. ZZT-01]WRR94930.1 TetR/AcrR family transcriptional regulator [Sinanaerobacter sp. ZZT-01]
MRIVKEAVERRNEILDAADELFGKKGFDGTSTNDILDIVGIARGTLYYHFKSKEEILDALIERYNEQLIKNAKKAASDKSLSVNERMVRAITSLNISGGSGSQIIEQMHKPQNALMHQKTQYAMLMGITPILAEIVREGNDQGIYDTPYPYECMEMIMAYGSTIFDDAMIVMSADEKELRIQAFIFNIERLLGVPAGSMVKYVMRMLVSSDEEDHE